MHAFFSPNGKVKNKKEMVVKKSVQYMHIVIYDLQNIMTDKKMLWNSRN